MPLRVPGVRPREPGNRLIDRRPFPTVNVRERALYHQIHPARLFTDVATAFASLVLLAQHPPRFYRRGAAAWLAGEY